ncbi:histidine kinase N-terminal 7TM domain-containing protein [Kineosporia sp. R_H_3]|uniref:histidine kinase N-terminal 7TM domain-containing protein n=1 Tax=Kineosporia sp. R_H_3 TaxID=1961848 RepID=UPI00117A7CEC|nr:histidine kinase N-terminal 7TM domain-containing protein [Kineosporia sp. R_H_3]
MSFSIVLGVVFGVGAAGYLALAWYVWRYRRAAGGHGLVALSLAVFVWTTCYAMELVTDTLEINKVWSGLKFVGIVAVLPGLAWFVDEYTGARRLTRGRLALLCIEPVAVLTLLAVPAWHDSFHFYPDSAVAASLRGERPIPEAGDFFWPHAVYTWVGVAICVVLLSTRLVRIAQPYRRQAYAIVVATALPMLVNVLFNVGVIVGDVDPTPFAFVLTAVVLFWGFFRLRLLDLVPVARGVVVEQMTDGVVVLDAYGRVVDTNPATAVLVGDRRSRVVGRRLDELVPALAPALDAHIPGTTTRDEVVLKDLGGRRTDVSLVLTSLLDRNGAETGRLAVLRDVSARVRTERHLRELLDQQTRLAETLEASLRPSRLPDVPGLRLAARSLPSGVGSQVSGDFYDVHPATGGEWAFVLGDVSGKGVEAAIVTSTARYTVRALSAQGWSPRQVLEQLNLALEPGEDLERFCTVVYGRITAAPAPGEVTGVRLTISLGGHPAPFVRRADGSVFAVGEPGTVLGLLPEVSVHETVVDLAPGDVLLAYTDGVTEARRNGEEFGDVRLAEVLGGTAAGLRGRTGAAAASLVADAVADRVVKEVVEFASDRDDVALLVLAVA